MQNAASLSFPSEPHSPRAHPTPSPLASFPSQHPAQSRASSLSSSSSLSASDPDPARLTTSDQPPPRDSRHRSDRTVAFVSTASPPFSLSPSTPLGLTPPAVVTPKITNVSSYFQAISPPSSSTLPASPSFFESSSFSTPNSTAPASSSSMPPSTQFRQGSTSLGSSHLWEPYPSAKNSSLDRKSSLHQSSHSLSAPFSPSSLCSLKFPPTSAPSLCTQSSPSETTDLKELNCDAVCALLQEAQTCEEDEQQHTILLLDMRPSVCFGVSTIKTSVSVSVPSMLLKRPMYSLSMVKDQLTTEREILAFSHWREFSNIVMFDATGSAPVKGTPMFCIAQKFRKEGFRARIGYIQGGYNAFQHCHSDFCCSVDGPVVSQRSEHAGPTCPFSRSVPVHASPRHRLHLGSLPLMVTRPTAGDTTPCQTPMIENPNVNPLFESVRQAMGLDTNITEEIPIRLPSGFSVESVRGHLPEWLLDATREPSGKTNLAERFQKIEIYEKKRLALLMLPQAMRSGRTTDFSIGAALEKGLKNRYNNIWPFDHSRVKIKECQDDHDDYINASFLKAPSSERSYIATQGPLPSTFLDFWKVIWEQNSRVIVMLTREFEMGRVKCHRYWPTSEEPILDLGPVMVTFLKEYLPDGGDETVVVRQMKISRSSQEPERTVTLIQYTGWPDFGVPETPLEVLKVVQLTNEFNSSPQAGPIVVHCSAGCGRTGAFCVIDTLLAQSRQNQLKAATTDAVFETVSAFREQRLSMVQTLRQYVFCYEALLWDKSMELANAGRTSAWAIPAPRRPAHKSASTAEFSFFG
ncbi:tyrosine-protein phosphatase 2/3 [Entomortierella parvispora]|uniref:protein-tyrosine-phosphatase n=1 Tax=Entomortierella parvispora TaxID=205924 RepID=A0A9P3M183_9FUNG|nr:tyrosine-protein phosphatase 2/3 [Entomortierella parvispora]